MLKPRDIYIPGPILDPGPRVAKFLNRVYIKSRPTSKETKICGPDLEKSKILGPGS